MPFGFQAFEFDLPAALLEQLVRVFEEIKPAPLTDQRTLNIPEAQGIYQLLLKTPIGFQPVYIGKTDAEAGLSKRLERHAKKVMHRQNVAPGDVFFKAIRVYVFTVIDLETRLIKYYGGKAGLPWNGSGFGSNDPGRQRDTTEYKKSHFDTKYPIDIDRVLEHTIPASGTAADILKSLKDLMPYTIRFETVDGNSRQPHPDLAQAELTLPITRPLTCRETISAVIRSLPVGWHATKLPSHIIIYKNDKRTFPSGEQIALSGE